MERKLFASNFGDRAVVECLRSDRPDFRDELVARSVHFYDEAIRRASNVRYLFPTKALTAEAERTLEFGFRPELRSYASACETTHDAERLADVCNRVRRCVRTAPPPLIRNGKQRLPDAYHAEWDRCMSAWGKASTDVLRGALCDAYMELGRKSPARLGDFLAGLDGATWKELYAGVQSRTGPDATPESLARSKSFLESRYGEGGRRADHVELSQFEKALSYFYDESFTDGSVYAGFSQRVLDRLDGRRRSAGNAMDGFVLRKDFASASESVPSKTKPYVDLFYANKARALARGSLPNQGPWSGNNPALEPVPGRGLPLMSVMRGCSDDAAELAAQVPVVAGMCNEMYARSGNIMGGVLLRAFHGRLPDEYASRCYDSMDAYFLSSVCDMYDELAQAGDGPAGAFVNALSSELYSGLSDRRLAVPKLFPRGMDGRPSVSHDEVTDEDGLIANQVPDDARTRQLLSAGGYLELAGQCMFRYGYEAYGRGNELNRFLSEGLSGKAPNETFLHIAGNCETPEDARTLARIVNIVCETRASVNMSDAFDSVLCEDLRKVLRGPDGFRSDELRDAFSSGLSGGVVSGFRLRELTDSLSLGSAPETYSEDDVLFARSQEFLSGNWFSGKSARKVLSDAVESSRKTAPDRRDEDDMFHDVGRLAASCCAEYMDRVERGWRVDDVGGLYEVMAGSFCSDDMRGAARVCSLCLAAVSGQRDAGPGVFSGLDESAVAAIRARMFEDVRSGYDRLPEGQRPKFLAGLDPSVQEDLLAGLPGCWSNGVLLEGVPDKLAPPTRYANRLNAFNCPSFGEPVARYVQPVFLQYQADLERGNEIRELVRQASSGEPVWSVDAQYKLSVSCLATYQAYGEHARAEAAGRIYEPGVSERTYSLYELAEQCDAAGRKDAGRNVEVLARVYRGLVDGIPDDGSAYAAGMRYAVKTDVARSMKFLESAGTKALFTALCDDDRYMPMLREAMTDMPVYVNADARRFPGRIRPKGIVDVRESMRTADCVRTGIGNMFMAGVIDADERDRRIAELNAIVPPAAAAGTGRDMFDVDAECETILGQGPSGSLDRQPRDGDMGDG